MTAQEIVRGLREHAEKFARTSPPQKGPALMNAGADAIEQLQAQLAAEKRRADAAVEVLERAMYTATTNHYDVDLCCMYCKYGPEGTCEGESTVLAGNPIDGQEYDWDCRRCSGVSVNERGGWEFDYDRWRGPQEAGEGGQDGT
jgi:hypothetical protein